MAVANPRALIDAGRADIQTIETVDLDLSVARTSVEFVVNAAVSITADPAGYDTPRSTTVSTTVFAGGASIKFGRQTNDPIRLEAGVFIRVPAGTRCWFSNAAQAAKMLRLYFCPPDYEIKFYLRNDAPETEPAVNFVILPDDVVPTLITAAQPDRLSVMIKNVDAANRVYIGFTALTTTAADGFPLDPGESMWLGNNTAAVYGLSLNAPGNVRVIVEG